METKFYTGNYLLAIGQPYVIISAKEENEYFIGEKIIIFEAFTGQILSKGNRIKFPKISGRTLDDFILSELQICQDDIFHKILYPNFKAQLVRLNYNVIIDLRESNSNILSLIRDKFPEILIAIHDTTINEKLKALIKIYKSIVIERNDFEL